MPNSFTKPVSANDILSALGGIAVDLGTSSGSANALAGASTVDTGTTFTSGRLYRIRANAANTGAATCSINGGTGVALKKPPSSTALASGDIANATELLLFFDGTNLQVLSGLTVSASDSSKVPLAGTSSLTGPLGWSSNSGNGTSSAVWVGKDANGAIVNVGSAGGSGALQIFSDNTLNFELDEKYGIQFSANQTGSGGPNYQIYRTNGHLNINGPNNGDVCLQTNSTTNLSVGNSGCSIGVQLTISGDLGSSSTGTINGVYKTINNSCFAISGGGGWAQSQGGFAIWYGIYHPSYPSQVQIYAGGGAPGSIRLIGSKVSVPSGGAWTTIASVGAFAAGSLTQGQITAIATGKGSIIMDWDGTTLTKLAGVTTLVVAGSAGATEIAFRVSGGNLQASNGTGGAIDVSCPCQKIH